MVNLKLSEFIEIPISNMSLFSDSGNMVRDAPYYYENPQEMVFIYNTNAVEYVIYQQKGFEHYISGKEVTKNKGFIDVAQNKIDRWVWSRILGLDYSTSENDQSMQEGNDKFLRQLGAVKDV